MIREAYEAYRQIVVVEDPAVKSLKPFVFTQRAADEVQKAIGTTEEFSVLQLFVPTLADADTTNTFACQVYVIAPTVDKLVDLTDMILDRLRQNQGPVTNRYRPRTQNVEGLAYVVTAVTFQLKI